MIYGWLIAVLPQKLRFSGAYIRKTLIEFTVRKIKKAWYALGNVARMTRFSTTVALYHISSRAWSVFKVLSRKEDYFTPRLLTNENGTTSSSLIEKDEVSAKMCIRSAAVNVAFRYVLFLSLAYASTELTKTLLYSGPTHY